MTVNLVLLILMIVAALWTVMGRSLLKAAIGLAVTSVVITVLMFRLDSPLAAVFELSVCAGLITVVFVSTISLTKPLTHKETIAVSKDRIKKYWYLPVIVILAGIGLWRLKIPNMIQTFKTYGTDIRVVLWNFRQLDMLGQILILIAGALGVAILFSGNDDER